MLFELTCGARPAAGIKLEIGMLHIALQQRRDLAHVENLVGVACVDEAARHARIFGLVGVLGHTETADGLDRLGACRAVRAHPGEHHGDRPLLLLASQRPEEIVNRTAMPYLIDGNSQTQRTVLERDRMAWTDHIHVVGLHGHTILDLLHR